VEPGIVVQPFGLRLSGSKVQVTDAGSRQGKAFQDRAAQVGESQPLQLGWWHPPLSEARWDAPACPPQAWRHRAAAALAPGCDGSPGPRQGQPGVCVGLLSARAAGGVRHAAGGSPAAGLPAQRVRLIAAGLQVAQHLLELDAGRQAAALAPSVPLGVLAGALASPPAPRSLSSRVHLSSSSGSSASRPVTAAAGRQPPGAAGHRAAGAGTRGSICRSARRRWRRRPAACGAFRRPAPGAAARGGGSLGAGHAEALHGQPHAAPALPAPAAPPAGLVALFEGSLAQAAAARGEPSPPIANAATGGAEGAGGSSSPARDGGGAPEGGAGAGQQPAEMEVGEAEAGPWLGAAVIAERLLDSFVLGGPGSAAAPASGSTSTGTNAMQLGGAPTPPSSAPVRPPSRHGAAWWLGCGSSASSASWLPC
jgi:uncharacterized protein YfiM (DUF2279 family)